MLSVSFDLAVTLARLLADPGRYARDVTLRPYRLTPTWRIVFAVGWTGVLVGLAAVWASSRNLGLATWWLGPPTDPRPVVVQLTPFLAPLALVVGALRSVRHLPWWGMLGAAAVGTVGLIDLRGFQRYGLVELTLAAAGALVSVASLVGVVRPVRAPTEPPR